MLLRLLFRRGAGQSAPSRQTRSAPTFWARPALETLEARLAPSDLDPGLAPDATQLPFGANLPAVSTVAPPILVISSVAPPPIGENVLPQTATPLAAAIAVSSEVAAEAACATIDAGSKESPGNTYSIKGLATAANLSGYTVSFSGIPELEGRVVNVNADGSFGTTFGWTPGGADTRTVNVALIGPAGSTCAQCLVTIHRTPDPHP